MRSSCSCVPTSLSDYSRIQNARASLGSNVGNLFILGHHYQHDTVILHTDLQGDSLELARRVQSLTARYIVFCGVLFMAESAALLTKQPRQKVFSSCSHSTCLMSDMAPASLVEAILRILTARGRKIVPLAYVNSSTEVKAVIGRYGGAICTSANAIAMLRWALGCGHGVLFLPDKNLAINTARRLGLSSDSYYFLDLCGYGSRVDILKADAAELIIWPGCCAIHNRFRLRHLESIRRVDPAARILVHPECRPEVVDAADAVGSTSFLIGECAKAPIDTHLIIGTEINLVERLARQYAQRKRIEPLYYSACSNMAKTTETGLADLLDRLVNVPDTVSPIILPPTTAYYAHLALQRMLDVCV